MDLKKLPAIVSIGNDDYHASEGVSKSGLWTLWQHTPAHYRYEVRDEKSPRHLLLGNAIHCAVLEPGEFETRYICGPDLNKNTKDWKNFVEFQKSEGLDTLDVSEFDICRGIRDAAHRNATVRALVDGARIEQAAYWKDEETGVLLRCKPDAFNPKLKLIGDLKSALNAGPIAFARSVANYGYHMQDAIYTEGWQIASKKKVNGFVFMVYEKEPPYAFACYELDGEAKAEGAQVSRRAIALYAEHLRKEEADPDYRWPAYPTTVETLSIPRWAFTETNNR